MKVERLIAILTALLHKERISAVWFADKFGVSVRTIYRDIATLENAGIPIVTYTGINGGISIIDSYKVDKSLFTNEDISTMLTSLQSMSTSLSGAKINQTLEKIRSLIPREQGEKIELKSKQRYVDMTPWSNNPRMTDTLLTLQKALEGSFLMRFYYTGRNAATELRTVEPHQLILKENTWYLRAYCKTRSGFRTFRVSRVTDAQCLAETFEPREFEQGMTDFKDWQHEQMITVELIISPSLKERALDYCHEEYMRELEDGRIAISLPFVESEMGYGVLLSMGHDCTVVSPPHVREELIRRIHLLNQVYQ